jgi:hypothetical protein
MVVGEFFGWVYYPLAVQEELFSFVTIHVYLVRSFLLLMKAFGFLGRI